MGLKDDQANIWKNRFDGYGAKRYWDHPRHNRRSRWFAKKLRKGYAFDSIFEVGCNSGRNLWHINRLMPDKKIGGLDINTHAISFALEKMPSAEFQNVDICDMDVDDKYDIVFTSGVLLHIPDTHVVEIIEKCIVKANKYVMHMETQGGYKVINGPEELNPTKKVSQKLRCVHNYMKIYTDLGYKPMVCTAYGHEDDARHLVVVEV